MDVELRHLRYFVAVAEELHFGRAASRLHMAQPPLSQAIRRLEEAVGCELFARTSRSVRLTPAGTAFLGRARRTLRNVEDDLREARLIGRGETGSLTVGFVGSATLSMLPGVLRRHLDERPGVQLRLREGSTAMVVAGLVAGDIDVGVVRDADPVDGFVHTTLVDEAFVAVLPAAHPRAGDASVSVAALEGDAFVSPARGTGARAFEKPLTLCEEHGFRPRIAHEATHWMTILRLVGAGLGVSLAPSCVRRIATDDIACVDLRETRVTSELALLHREGEERPMVHAFRRTALADPGGTVTPRPGAVTVGAVNAGDAGGDLTAEATDR